MKQQPNPEVDAYVAEAAGYAQPILSHLRELVHKACPDVVEEMKWSRPFFVHRGTILCNMSAFKEHCSFGFWGAEIGKALHADGVVKDGAMGSLGRITDVKKMPPDTQMLGYIRRAAEFIESGQGETFVAAQRRVVKAPKVEIEEPVEFTAALKKNTAAARAYVRLSPSCRREYVEWIAGAKRAETRAKRIGEAIGWIAEGKQRNWKYEERAS